MVNNLNRTAKESGMEINSAKTKVMRTAKKQVASMRVSLDDQYLEEVDSFKYRGILLTNDGTCSKEIRTRITMGKVAYEREKRLLTGKLDLQLKKRLVKTLIWSVVVYGAET